MKNRSWQWLSFLLILVLTLSFPVKTLAAVFGAGVYLSSEPDGDKSTVADMMSDLGISITRMTVNYSGSIDWTPYDTAVDLTRNKNIENLILLHYEGSLPSSGDFCNFVGQVASRYAGKTVAYEILNEADNYLSGSNYASYLSCAYDQVKANDSGAKVIASGLTARSEATSFWQGIYNAGAWDKLDAVGLHPYREKAPEVVDFNIGDFITSINIAANFINSHGGGKKIWLTEFGTKSSTVGDTNQGNYVARSYIMARNVPEVDKVIMYRFRENGEGYGLVNADLSHKVLWDRYKNVLTQLDYSGTAERIYVYDKSTIDSFDSVSDYKTDLSSNASVSLNTASGYSGSGMKLDYNFNASNSFVVAKKQKDLSGSPVGLGIWAKGPSTSSILKLRVVDANGETFQFDLGKVTGSWTFYKFDFQNDVARVSWGGNGSMDYPIKFDSVVYDAQSGNSTGTLYVDEVVAINSAADLYAYKLGSKLAYWKLSGSKSASACGKTLTFSEAPQITSVSSCSVWDGGSSSSSSSSDSSSTTTSTTTSTGEKVYISQANSKISADKDKAKADGQDAITFTVTLKNNKNEVTSSSKLKAEVSGSANTASELKKEGDDYKMTLKSSKAEEKEVKFKIDNWELGSKKVFFEPGDYSATNTQVIPNRWTATIGEEIELELKVRDAFDNELSTEKKPTQQWQLVQSEGTVEVIQEPAEVNGWKAKIKTSLPQRLVLTANYNNTVLTRQSTIYYNPQMSLFEEIPTDKVFTLKKDEQLKLTAKPGENLALVLDGMSETAKVVVKISSTATYFWLSKNNQGNYQTVVEIPQEEGEHEILVYSENEKGETSEFAKGTLAVNKEAVTAMVAEKTPALAGWQQVVLSVTALLLLVLAFVLIIPRSRRKFWSFLQMLWRKIRISPQSASNPPYSP